jgi:hypothetical protein
VGEVSGVDVGERQLLWANNPTELNAPDKLDASDQCRGYTRPQHRTLAPRSLTGIGETAESGALGSRGTRENAKESHFHRISAIPAPTPTT